MQNNIYGLAAGDINNDGYPDIYEAVHKDLKLNSLEIINVRGRILMIQKQVNDDLSFAVCGLQEGLYIIRINTGKDVEVKNLVAY